MIHIDLDTNEDQGAGDARGPGSGVQFRVDIGDGITDTYNRLLPRIREASLPSYVDDYVDVLVHGLTHVRQGCDKERVANPVAKEVAVWGHYLYDGITSGFNFEESIREHSGVNETVTEFSRLAEVHGVTTVASAMIHEATVGRFEHVTENFIKGDFQPFADLAVDGGLSILTPGSFVKHVGNAKIPVTSFAESGATPDLDPGRWSIVGGPSVRNSVLTGTFRSPTNAITEPVHRSNLRPAGLGGIQLLLGHQRIKP